MCQQRASRGKVSAVLCLRFVVLLPRMPPCSCAVVQQIRNRRACVRAAPHRCRVIRQDKQAKRLSRCAQLAKNRRYHLLVNGRDCLHFALCITLMSHLVRCFQMHKRKICPLPQRLHGCQRFSGKIGVQRSVRTGNNYRFPMPAAMPCSRSVAETITPRFPVCS